MLMARGIDVSDHLGTVFGIPPPRSRRDASTALPPGSLQERWPAPGAHGVLAPGGVARSSSTTDSKAVAHQGHRLSHPTVSPPPSAALSAQPLICLPGAPPFSTHAHLTRQCRTWWLPLRLVHTLPCIVPVVVNDGLHQGADAFAGKPVDEKDTGA